MRSQWCVTNSSRFVSSRFPTLKRFTWLLKFSKCFCFLMRDRLADSRFDNIRLRFRSSIVEFIWPELRFGSFELVKKACSWSFSSEKTDSWFGREKRGSGQSHGIKLPSKVGNWIPNNPSEEGMAGKADNMVGKPLIDGGRWKEEREERSDRGEVFMGSMGSDGGVPHGGILVVK
ncbi:hypothetical protein Acr_05g0002940 [Actinidia rufa]|uniref:Uncharacterized protein n=1 Tax=Actinidia rufa TaxID=165716 RepID=A0A7J0EJL0_9ERIC|nr:hypothetical protein Acr_05g0002940 [Actinidia rufa]